MSRLAILLIATSLSTPALAQHEHHSPPPRLPQDEPGARDPHAGHRMPPQPAPDPQARPDPAPSARPDPHAGHAAPQAQDPPAGHTVSQRESAPPQTDPHAGHRMEPPATSAEDPHAGHQADAIEEEVPPVAPPPAEALSGPVHAADGIYGVGQMAEARDELHQTHGDLKSYRFLIDQFEVSLRDGNEGFAWEDAQFWYGGDIDKLWIKSEGEGAFGEGLEQGDVQALWSRAIDPWFDLQAGVRLNFGRGPERPHLVVGLQGLAPYWFEIDLAAFLSSKGDVTARLEGEYDLRIAQRLILQPRAELEFALQDVPELRIGSGLSSTEAGLRLRYEIIPEFAPYVGVQYEHAFGDTARFLRADGDDPRGWSLVLGIRTWF